jgi:hypothetical protein
MLDTKKLSQLSKEAQLDLIKCKTEVARTAYAMSKSESQEVQDVFLSYKNYCEEMLEKAIWSLT